ncbi:MAG: gamma-glutamyltransferase, partial [Noviherbaspirillum sp.]
MSRENHGVAPGEMPAGIVPPAPAGPREAVGRHAAAATGHPASSRAALDVLAAGGSVADAAIAASAVLAVVLPHATSIGGDAFFLVRDAATGEIQGLNASGRAPQAAAAAAFPEGIPQRGARAAVVPGLVKGWEALHARLGCKAWDSLFDAAIRAAKEGFPVSPTLAQSVAALERSLRADPGCAAAFFPAGTALAAGVTFRQERLAASLAAIARGGAAAFYEGELGRRLTGHVAAAGGLLRPGDLERFTADWVNPMQLAFGGHEIAVMPPNSYGVLMLMQLQA